MKKWLFSTALLAIGLLLSNCQKDPEVIIQTETVRDTVTVTVRDTITIVENDTTVVVEVDTVLQILSEDSTVVFILIRHAEITPGGSNPPLNADGWIRANELVRVLQNTDLHAIYSTDFSRTQGTVTPLANDRGLSIRIYDGFELEAFKESALTEHKGQNILVCGHGDTTPWLLNLLTNTDDYDILPEDSHDNLYIVRVKTNGEASVTHLEYGADTP